MKVSPRRNLFHKEEQDFSPYRLILWLVLILVGVYLIYGLYVTEEIEPIFAPTPLPTRTAYSHQLEGEALYLAGDLPGAIQAYEQAIAMDPSNPQTLAELARIQTYYSSLLTFEAKREMLAEALANIERAVELDAFSSEAHAIRALVLDWNASVADTEEQRQDLLAEASQAAVRAVQLDSQNALAYAYQAEVLIDQLQWNQARQLAELAVEREPNLMDTHRVFAYVLEATGFYGQAIDEYKQAAEIAPNLTFLYISIGLNYRQLQFYDQALEYFDKAASINLDLGIKDPLPYVAIAKTYARQGEYFAAARNAQRAIDLDPTDPDLYGQLGDIFFRARNFEGSIPVLRCAVSGCSADQNDQQGIEVTGLPLTDASAPYYYLFASVLSGLNQCEEAIPIMDQLTERYQDQDAELAQIVMGIVEESLLVCQSFNE